MGKTIATDETRILPAYWEEAKAELMKRDRIMRKLIPQFGDLHLVGRGEAFSTLARSIIGQQISSKAADSVWQQNARRHRLSRLVTSWQLVAYPSVKQSIFSISLTISRQNVSIVTSGPRWKMKKLSLS
jgi:hypothetical protein